MSCICEGASSNTSSSIDRAWRGMCMQPTLPHMQPVGQPLPLCGRGCTSTGDEVSSLLLHPRTEPQPLDWREALLPWRLALIPLAAPGAPYEACETGKQPRTGPCGEVFC